MIRLRSWHGVKKTTLLVITLFGCITAFAPHTTTTTIITRRRRNTSTTTTTAQQPQQHQRPKKRRPFTSNIHRSAAKSGGIMIETTSTFFSLVLYTPPPPSSTSSHEKLTLVFYSAPWCGPCRLSNPVVRDIMKEFADRIVVYEVCTDDLPEVASDAGVVSIPTIQLYYEGVLKDTIVGCVAKNVLSSAIVKVYDDIFGT